MSVSAHIARPYLVVLPAGGSGQRMQNATSKGNNSTSKQFIEISGRAVIQHALEPFLNDADCQGIVIAVPESEVKKTRALFTDPRVSVIMGGPTRMQSVMNGLKDFQAKFTGEPWVMVHDAARANLHNGDLQKLKERVYAESCGGILAIPARDSLKLGDAGRVRHSIDRSNVWQAMTPQMFQLNDLANALDSAFRREHEVTDESSAMEIMGAEVILVQGRPDNIKLTYPEDLPLLEKLIEERNSHN